MTTLAHEANPPGESSQEIWEAVPVPDDFAIEIANHADQAEVHIMGAFWNGEAKITALIEPLFDGVFMISDVRRPDFWGDDVRSLAEQLAEYEMGLNGILTALVAKGATSIELANQEGLSASAAAKMRLPGWKRLWRSEEYWASGSFSLEDAIASGNVVSIILDKIPAAQAAIGELATSTTLRDAAELSTTE